MKTCKTCIFHDDVDEYTYWCDIHGACTTNDLIPCSRYIPIDGAEEEEEE